MYYSRSYPLEELLTLSFRVFSKMGLYPIAVHSCQVPAFYIHQQNFPLLRQLITGTIFL